ncbi:rhodanese-like domain-containing protein [Sinobacterium caligoides]|uniref:Rhodanese-like domain-containing protein n=1 Tax=Sinobacterium caligoides TaxID=933926 RepID=A0A3N2DNC9_9GAMM|nr:cyclic nucleotide-binding domain-containing protein [Sinobacterium caligoides]ROS01313.1 rhodanese-like domain-containing protein [Sinobacterium caligoides]
MSESQGRQLLRAYHPLSGLSDSDLRGLWRYTERLSFCRGQTLFDITDGEKRHFYLLHGEVGLHYQPGQGADDAVWRAGADEAAWPLPAQRPYPYCARALTDCTLLCIDAERVDTVLAWSQAAQYLWLELLEQRDLDESWLEALLHSNLFHRVPPINIRQVIDHFVPERVEAGQYVVRQGEAGDCCYLLKHGTAEVVLAAGQGDARIVAQLEAGSCFGEEALINDAPRNASVRMLTAGELMCLDKQAFFPLLRQPQAIKIGLAEACQNVAQGSAWLDVRTSIEFDRGHCYRALSMPLNLLRLKMPLLDRQQRYIVYCNSGRRSAAAAHLLSEAGFKVKVLRGGLERLRHADQSLLQVG